MFAIAFDLVVADTAQHHPKGVAQAYADIGSTLANFGFSRVQGSPYTTPPERSPKGWRASVSAPMNA